MMFDKLFQLMADKQASDIFISAGAPIHIKIQGHTVPINQQVMEPPMIKRMIYEMMNAEQIERFEHDKELNLSFGRRDLGNFRVNVFWQRNSVGVVVRYIQGAIPTLESLNLPTTLADVVMQKRGLILVVGATGSGKSTTLASMIDHRNRNKSGHILTIEDPIEYLFKHGKSVINQREVGIDTHSWHEALRNAMRQAPDCILIGEIRDRETMQAALAYSQTGHLCLATLHANNAYHALNRIVNFFPLENRPLLYLDLAVALKCVISQRLVRRPDGKRIPAVEMLMNTRHVSELIERGELNSVKEAMEQSLAPGSQTFEQDLFRLFHAKMITLDEALTNADSPSNLHWLINNGQLGESGSKQESEPLRSPVGGDFESTQPDGASFREFTLHMDDEHGS
ncbi:PilT/PilU family type 4a pilus ATPase [Pseudothauera nasutitermitis]|uniref:PilT/PilU family type 4a pilus ATPase n=1 Tax=Pseudothauera nasutitermitis TaxID=2565930 RepID=A0A4S4B0R4_9RHOO|nr:PilT/PilU family type 4a pilus ATPase [Pseudothauera nasutitermitis]THF66084.1 PilT/PilU family type 4a pilus ATPase [Pseudothauera nasutitermitis]